MTQASRELPLFFTPQQRLFTTTARDTQRHIFLRATAGAGKTTTLVEAAWHLPQPGVFFAYNKHAVADLQSRLPARIRARTLHAHGVMLLRQATGHDVVPSEDKARTVALLAGERRYTYIAALAWSKAREEGLLTLDVDTASYIASLVEWPDTIPALINLMPRMHAAGQRLWDRDRMADFTDFLWLPVTNGYGHASLPLALVDEAQDLTPLRQTFVLHLLGLPESPRPGRLIFCGDPDQAIYLHAGADPEALNRLKARVQAVELPLSVSFRCPRDVVAYAQAHSTFIQPAPQAKVGHIEHHSADDLAFERGDVVLCRTNAPLIRLALQLMIQGRSVSLVGRDLEKRLGEGLQAILPSAGTYRNDAVTELVRGYYTPKADPLKARLLQGDRPAKRILTELLDLCRCLRFLAWVVSRQEGEATQADALTLLGVLCREQVDADVILSSVHRAKGKEWPRVTILYPEMMPLASGDPEEEKAVQFVAITRAQDTLRFAYGKEAWATGWRVKPGREGQEVFRPAPPQSPAAPDEPAPATIPLPPVPAGRSPQPELAFQDLPSLAAVEGPTHQGPLRPSQGRARLKLKVVPETGIVPTPVAPTPLDQAEAVPRAPKLAAEPRIPRSTGPAARFPIPAFPTTTPSPQNPVVVPEDERPWPLLGGTTSMNREALRERLEALAEEPRPFLTYWAQGGLDLLGRISLQVEDVMVHLETLEQFEQAARLARVAVSNPQTSAAAVQVCLFNGSVARIRAARIVRKHIRFLRVEVDGQELVFERRHGELLEGGAPLTPYLITAP